MLRVLLFLGTNLAVMLVLGVVVSLFGIDRWAYSHTGMNLQGMLVLCAVFGMGGAFISLAMSKWLAKMSVGAKVIDQPRSPDEQWLFATVRRHAEAAGIGMPEIAIYDAPDMNAFATGMSRNHALVAVSTGLLRSMNRDEVSAVLGHEVTHVANGDMVTLALIQGVLNTFVMFLARVIGGVIDGAISGNRDGESRGGGMIREHQFLIASAEMMDVDHAVGRVIDVLVRDCFVDEAFRCGLAIHVLYTPSKRHASIQRV